MRAFRSLPVVLMMVSCSSGGGAPAGMASSPSPTEASFANGGDCPAARDPELGPDTGCVSVVESGDSKLRVFALVGADARPRSWRIRLDAPAGSIDRPLDAGNAYSYPRALGASDVDGDGDDEWWVKVEDFTSHGAPWSGMHLFFVRGRALAPLALEGDPLGVHYGGIARLGEGARCERGRLVLLRAEARNVRNTRWKVSHRTYSLDGSRARLVRRVEDLLEISDYNDPALDPYYEVDCAGFTYP